MFYLVLLSCARVPLIRHTGICIFFLFTSKSLILISYKKAIICSIFGSTKMQTTNCVCSDSGRAGWECLTGGERPWRVERDLTSPGCPVVQSLNSFPDSKDFHAFMNQSKVTCLQCCREHILCRVCKSPFSSFGSLLLSHLEVLYNRHARQYPSLSHNPASFF